MDSLNRTTNCPIQTNITEGYSSKALFSPVARDKVEFQIFTGGEPGARKLGLGARKESKGNLRQALASGIACRRFQRATL